MSAAHRRQERCNLLCQGIDLGKDRICKGDFGLPARCRHLQPKDADPSLEKIDTLKAKVREAFQTPDGKDLLKTYHLQVAKVEAAPVDKPAVAPVLSAPNAAPSQKLAVDRQVGAAAKPRRY